VHPRGICPGLLQYGALGLLAPARTVRSACRLPSTINNLESEGALFQHHHCGLNTSASGAQTVGALGLLARATGPLIRQPYSHLLTVFLNSRVERKAVPWGVLTLLVRAEFSSKRDSLDMAKYEGRCDRSTKPVNSGSPLGDGQPGEVGVGSADLFGSSFFRGSVLSVTFNRPP
jgi:hypothetical protein